MRFSPVKQLVVAGGIALSLAVGAVAVTGIDEVREAYAFQDDTEIDGVVEAMPPTGMVGTWQVGGRTVQVTEATEIDQELGALAVGTAVEVEGALQADGSILASELEVEDAEDAE